MTSRAITVDQMSTEDNLVKFYNDDVNVVKYWNGIDDNNMEDLRRVGIRVMTYDKVINLLINQNDEGHKTLDKVKIVIVDECHTLFSDTFIQNIEVLKIWIRDMIMEGEKYFLALTATPGILLHYMKNWGVKINQVNKEIISNYRAKQLICTNFYTIPYLVATNQLDGKTLIMCKSIKDCLKLQSRLSNAAILVSKQNKVYYTPEMDEIRKCIVSNRTLPETFTYVDPVSKKSEKRPLDILISTSTAREGFTLLESSGVKNVICCFTDEMHITQFVGRCRFNIDTLVVADMHRHSDNLRKDLYIEKCAEDYRAFIHNFENLRWFNSISHLVDHPWDQTRKIILGTDERRFIDFINSKWLVPLGCPVNEINKYKIYKEEDKEAIVDIAHDCKLFNLPRCALTFHRVVDMLEHSLGYQIESGRFTVDYKKHTYKLIMSFDEEKVIFMPKASSI